MSNCRKHYHLKGCGTKRKRRVIRGQELGGWALWGLEGGGGGPRSSGLKPLRRWHQMAKTWTSKERSTAPQVSISTEEAQKAGCSNSLVGEEMQAALICLRGTLQKLAPLRGSSAVGAGSAKRSWERSKSCRWRLEG